MSKDNRVYLVHIIECIERIERYTSKGKASFLNDPMAYDATLRKLQIMAESTQRLSEDLKQRHLGVPWRKIAGFRNILVHEYLGNLDNTIVWSVIEKMLPELKSVTKKELENL